LPTTIASVIRERLRLLNAGALDLLRGASVLGREFGLVPLGQVTGRSLDECARCLGAAVDAALVQALSSDHYRFAHILFREALYQELAVSERETLHRRAAEELDRVSDVNTVALLYHLVRGGAAVAEQAIEVGMRVAQAELEQLAFVEAVDTCEQLQITLDQFLPGDDQRRFAVLLALGRARLAAGMVALGRHACVLAARIAAKLSEPERFAEAALAYGSLVVLSEVDPDMVKLLEESLRLLPERDSALRSRLTARLAGAKQPSANPEEAFALARSAIRMARRLGDEQALFESLREGIGALMDLGPPSERRVLNEEYHALAEKRGDLQEQFRAKIRMLFDDFELGRMDRVRQQVQNLALLAAQLKHPYYEWQATTYAMAERTFSGRLLEAERLLDRAKSISARARDPNAPRVMATLELFLARAYGDTERVLEALQAVEQHFGDSPYGRILLIAEYSEQGHRDASSMAVDPSVLEWMLGSGDLSTMEDFAKVAVARQDRELAARLVSHLEEHRDRWISGGQTTRLLEPIAEYTLARLAMTLGEIALAEERYTIALEAVKRAGAEPYQLAVGIKYAACLERLGRFAERARLVDELTRLASERGWPGWLKQLHALVDTAPGLPAARDAAPALAPLGFRMELAGEVWSFNCVDRSFQLKDNKGLRLLYRLVSEPGREFHVLDLSGPNARPDTGGALEALDDEARRQYAARVRELEHELDEARSNNDIGRAESLLAQLTRFEQELAQAFGLGGRKRPIGAAAERARVNVQRRLRDAITRVEKQHEALGRYLRWTIKTGSYCRYDPD
jgi:tetratricopeptide (TPR) repeat protein